MTEVEWLACADPQPMLDFLRGRASERKLRLFGCACCRKVWELLDAWVRTCVESAEKFAEGLIEKRNFNAARDFSEIACTYEGRAWCSKVEAEYTPFTIEAEAEAAHRVWESDEDHADAAMSALDVGYREFNLECALRIANRPIFAFELTCNVIRDIFGNPFHPVILNPRLIPDIVLTNIQSDERVFDQMSELADVFESVGCTNSDILTHCRSEGPHVRGCWVVDLLLGKQ